MLGVQKTALPQQKKVQTLKTTVVSAKKSPIGIAVIVMVRVQTMLWKVKKNVQVPKNQE